MMKSKFIHSIRLFIALVFSAGIIRAQQVQVSARIDSSSILIGNQTHIHLTAAYDLKNGSPKIEWPQMGDSLVPKIEIITKSKIDTLVPDKANPTIRQQVQDIIISGYDSGYYAIPPFKFIINGDTEHPRLTEAMILQVQTVHVDTTKGFKDIKGPIQVKFSLLDYLPYILLGLLGLVIIAGIVWYIIWSSKKRSPVVVTEIPKVIIPPHIIAIQELEKLALKKLWQEGKIKEYYTGVTDILREYIYGRYAIGAPEMTSDEIMLALKRKDIDEAMKKKLREIFVISDLVKFAKENPLPTDHEFCFNASLDFIKETAEIIAEPSSDKPTEPNEFVQNPVVQ